MQWVVSGTSKKLPIELGLHFMIGYGRVGSGSFGASLAYIFGHPNNSNIKLGLGVGEVDLKDVDASGKGFGPHVGDVNFTSQGTQFKPYVEFEYSFLSFSSIFIRTGYRIINGEKSVVKAVKKSTDALLNDPPRVTERKDSLFYSAAGLELGFGISIIF